MGDTRKSAFGKTFMERFLRLVEKTSVPFSKCSGKSASEMVAFLDLRTKEGNNAGPERESSWEMIAPSLGEDWTLNIGESPSVASECSLSSILEDNVPDGYFLSVKACEGILRRSEDPRGKPLPPLLKQALLNTIGWQKRRSQAVSG